MLLRCLPGGGICVTRAAPVAGLPARRVALPILPVVHALRREQVLVPASACVLEEIARAYPQQAACSRQHAQTPLQASGLDTVPCRPVGEQSSSRVTGPDAETVMTAQLAASITLPDQAAGNNVQAAVMEAAYWRPSSREPEGMLWQCRMGDRKGGDIRPALLRLEPLLLRPLPLWWSWHPSHPSARPFSATAGGCAGGLVAERWCTA